MKSYFLILSFLLTYFSTQESAMAFSVFEERKSKFEKDSVGLTRRGNRLYIKHKVKSGEDIYQIARKYGVNKETLIAINPETRYPLKKGQIILIPHPQTTYRISQLKGYKVRPSETLYSIATKFQTDVLTLKELNELYTTQIQTGQELLIPFPSSHQDLYAIPPKAYTQALDSTTENTSAQKKHIVAKGETLYSISRLYKVSVEDLKKWNKLISARINTGQEIIVEEKEEKETLFIVASASNSYTQKPKSKTYDQSGVCKVSLNSERLIGLHRAVPKGTKIRVFNESTGRSITIEVIGKIQNTDQNKNVVVIISKEAGRRLGTMSKEFPVYITWEQ